MIIGYARVSTAAIVMVYPSKNSLILQVFLGGFFNELL